MKKLLFIALLFAGCSSGNQVFNYRFADSPQLHTFTIDVDRGFFSTDIILFIDGENVVTANMGAFEYQESATALWNGKSVLLEVVRHDKSAGKDKNGNDMTVITYDVQALVNNERVGRWND